MVAVTRRAAKTGAEPIAEELVSLRRTVETRKARKARQRQEQDARPSRAERKQEKAELREEMRHRPGPRGWRGPGNGSSVVLQDPPQWRSSTAQTCGLWPWSAASGAPTVGVPLGTGRNGSAAVCGDPISWFQRAKLISNPSAFILGVPGLGKSTLARRWAVGLAARGVLPVALGDLKPDHVDIIERIGGQVIKLGPGLGAINVLDPGEASAASRLLSGSAREVILADSRARRRTMLEALLTIVRHSEPSDHEMNLVDEVLRLLDERHNGVPVMGDMLQVIKEAPETLRAVAVDRGRLDTYYERVDDLERSLVGLANPDGRWGIFGRQTSVPMRRDRPCVYDVSSLYQKDDSVEAAALLACWSSGFATINVANELAAAGVEPQRHYFIILDELWKAIRSGKGMVDRIDGLTRLNRNIGVGQVMISHTMADLEALADPEDVKKAKGFVERAGMVCLAGLPSAEMPLLSTAVALSDVEKRTLVEWTAPGAWDAETGEETDPPGRGWFLLKVGHRPGVPVRVGLTDAERGVNDTNKKWHEQSRIGQGGQGQEGAA
ncbi:hypothetical protein ATK17_3927 [Branchiibius hedensis]|uniref:AAA+ ATPase domain-containing protein n=1 Tax=Branchiibius hedensis TaxID=672460 RepID=A0A2Y9BQ14_9MICO|nr:hypothetical protein ATK17_3927 [Branchiibius hedensis]SSA59112.1 hypothetical protein SAMN04489750_3927 [Branchiibius hedensis]